MPSGGDAYWRVTHRPAVTFSSCGPGSANLPVAIASAMMDSSALLAITANVPSVQFNRGAFQETYRHYQAEFPSVLRPYVKRSFQPTRPDQMPLVMRQAFQEMLGGRPGPVQVDVPLDLFVETVDGDGDRPKPVGEMVRVRMAAERGRLEAALALLLGAERPVVLAGGGTVLSEAEHEVRALAERLGVPVVSTPLAAGVLAAGHPLYFGNVGRRVGRVVSRTGREATGHERAGGRRPADGQGDGRRLGDRHQLRTDWRSHMVLLRAQARPGRDFVAAPRPLFDRQGIHAVYRPRLPVMYARPTSPPRKRTRRSIHRDSRYARSSVTIAARRAPPGRSR